MTEFISKINSNAKILLVHALIGHKLNKMNHIDKSERERNANASSCSIDICDSSAIDNQYIVECIENGRHFNFVIDLQDFSFAIEQIGPSDVQICKNLGLNLSNRQDYSIDQLYHYFAKTLEITDKSEYIEKLLNHQGKNNQSNVVYKRLLQGLFGLVKSFDIESDGYSL